MEMRMSPWPPPIQAPNLRLRDFVGTVFDDQKEYGHRFGRDEAA